MPHCKLKHCPFDQDGRCVENQLPNCRNLVPDSSAASVSPELSNPVATETVPPPTHEEVYSGRKLTGDEAAPILQSNPQLVMLGGMVESGKTTLLARIFEMFQRGTVGGFRFMTSRTPVEFDKLSWHATMECGATCPSTEHTPRSENNLLLHMRIRAVNGSSATHLLIGDIPGEVFPEAVAEESVCRALSGLRRANHLLLFLDGAVLCDSAKRHDHCGKVFDFISRTLQTGQVGQHTVLHLVISKCDLLGKDGEVSSDVLKFVHTTERAFRTKFASRVGGIHFWRVAARPEHPFEPTLTEIEKLFGVWTTRAAPHADALTKPIPRLTFHRDFCRFRI
jgi:hypothetical protein